MLGMGEKLRAARMKKNLSLRELAAKAEVSASLLSQIENGKANPSVRSLHSIADSLSLPVDYFFPDKNRDEKEGEAASTGIDGLTASELRAEQPGVSDDDSALAFSGEGGRLKGPVMRAEARPTIELEGGVTWSRLTSKSEDGVEYLHIQYEVGASSGVRMSHHLGREFGLVLEGELLLELGFERYMLRPGDSVIFDSATPHRLTNIGQTPMQAVWVVFNQE